ncbi:hypothetical protein GOBAR_DD00747 [Gossypium barbadense]|nr:hypothetical protein GOBAR_DD00747 [Gossypium barbadense]
MGKKRRSKQINQEKQRHDPDDNNNPTITSSSRPRNKWGFRFEFGHGRGILVASISSKGALQLDSSAGKQELPRPFDLFLKLNLTSANHLSRRYMWFDWGRLEENHPLQTHQPSSNTMKVKSLYLISEKMFQINFDKHKGAKSLTICRWFFETSMCKPLSFSSRDPLLCMSELKELWWIDCSMERESINALLCFLKLCPNLKRLFVTIDPKCYNMPSTGKFSDLVIVPDKLDDLKAVKLEGFADEEKENFIARRLIPLFGENNPVIISKSGGKCVKHLVKVAKLEKKGKYPYKFKVVENVDENFPDHVHMNV